MIRGAPTRPSHLSDLRRPGVWPRVYRMRRLWRVFLSGLGAVMIAGGLGATVAILATDPRGPAPWALLPLVLSALGGYLVAAVRAERVVLHEDAIELTELGKGTRRARRDEIVGLRWVPLQHGQKQLVLELRGGGRPLKMGWVIESDPVLDGWLAAIPDLDAQERAREEAELLRSTALGATAPERARALARARTVARALTGLSVAACAWAWLYPRPYEVAVAVLASLPLVALALLLAGRGVYGFEAGRNDPRPSIVIPVLGPSLVLGVRAIQDLHVLDWKPVVAGSVAGAVVLAALIAVGDARVRRSWSLAIMLPLLAFYPGGLLSLANALLDRGEAEVFRVLVRGKRVSSGSKHTSYELTLEPWGPVTRPATVDVGRGTYELTPVGDRVCVVLHPGAVGVRWYVVLRCDRRG